jgi:hypothetical protein
MAGRKKLETEPIIRTVKLRFYRDNAADMELLARVDALPARTRAAKTKQAFLFGGLTGENDVVSNADDAELGEALDSFLG